MTDGPYRLSLPPPSCPTTSPEEKPSPEDESVAAPIGEMKTDGAMEIEATAVIDDEGGGGPAPPSSPTVDPVEGKGATRFEFWCR